MPEDKKIFGSHTIVMEKRENISITGVLDVISFDEETIVIDTEMGVLVIKGINLHVVRLNLEKGDLEIEGEIESLVYEEQSNISRNKNSLLSKIFK